MSPRRAVTDALERLAFAAELLGDESARRYGAASWAVRHLDGDVSAMFASGELAEVKGIGKTTLAIIGEVLEGRRPARLAELEAQLPEGLFAIRRVKGLGPKKVKALWQELGITSLAELEYACRENRLVDLKGFGAKTQANVLVAIQQLLATEGLCRRDQAEMILGPLVAAIRECASCVCAQAVGDFARGCELVRELGVVAVCQDEEAGAAAARAGHPPEIAVPVHLVERGAYGVAAVWYTSSEEHRDALVARAKERGLALGARGLFEASGSLVPCETEDTLYDALGLVPTAPERREPGVPLVEKGRAVPRLVTRADLRGALHNHTTASDGSASLEDMQAAAREQGLAYLGISEHSHSAFYARGLDADALARQLETIRGLNAAARGCVLLSGVESDILQEGELDYGADVLAQLDVVIASVHRRYSQDAAAMTARLLGAAHNPYTDVVGHPTGRLLLGRAPSPFDAEAFLDACRANGTAVELNGNPARLDFDARHLAMAKERGVLVSIAADAHSTRELENLEHGVAIARRAGLTAEDVLNTRTVDELRAWIRARRPA